MTIARDICLTKCHRIFVADHHAEFSNPLFLSGSSYIHNSIDLVVSETGIAGNDFA